MVFYLSTYGRHEGSTRTSKVTSGTIKRDIETVADEVDKDV